MRAAALVFGVILATTGTAFAQEQTWTGAISDSMCGMTHKTDKHGKALNARDCARECVRKGGQYVLVSDGKVFKLINRDADLADNAGRTVRLTGALNGETIRVSKIERTGNATDRP